MNDKFKKKCLYLVAVPIGNFDDFSFRAIETLMHADIIIGEEFATTEKILKRLNIGKKEIYLLNEHNEINEAKLLFNIIIENNFSAALISEAGTPCIADPGAVLVNLFHEHKYPVVPVPGVSAITSAMMVCGGPYLYKKNNIEKNSIKQGSFKYFGFLSANKETRQNELKLLNTEKIPIVILEAPYRMNQVLKDIATFCGKEKKILFAYKLTQPDELIIKSTISEVLRKTENIKKGEFVIVLLP